MAENYPPGLQRIWYKSKGFQEGLNATIDFLSSSMRKFEGLPFIEESGGRYYLDFLFDERGNWMSTIYENGQKTTCQCYWIYRSEDLRRVIRGNIVGR